MHLPTDRQQYNAHRSGFQLLESHRPSVVATPRDADELAAAVRFAATRGMPIATQCTGHAVTEPLQDEGLLINTRQLATVTIDPTTHTARIGAGATWRNVIDQASRYGLAPLSGSLPSVGAVSYILGGGVGLLARLYGFAADHVRSLQVVTPDGRYTTVSPHQQPDLFWALRGGGGSFAVVTEIEVDLMPVRHLLGGGLVFNLATYPNIGGAWLKWTKTLPDQMTSAFLAIEIPGGYLANISIAFAGPTAQGIELIAPLRELGPVQDGVREISFADSHAVFNEPDQPHAYVRDNRLLDIANPTPRRNCHTPKPRRPSRLHHRDAPPRRSTRTQAATPERHRPPIGTLRPEPRHSDRQPRGSPPRTSNTQHRAVGMVRRLHRRLAELLIRIAKPPGRTRRLPRRNLRPPGPDQDSPRSRRNAAIQHHIRNLIAIRPGGQTVATHRACIAEVSCLVIVPPAARAQLGRRPT